MQYDRGLNMKLKYVCFQALKNENFLSPKLTCDIP